MAPPPHPTATHLRRRHGVQSVGRQGGEPGRPRRRWQQRHLHLVVPLAPVLPLRKRIYLAPRRQAPAAAGHLTVSAAGALCRRGPARGSQGEGSEPRGSPGPHGTPSLCVWPSMLQMRAPRFNCRDQPSRTAVVACRAAAPLTPHHPCSTAPLPRHLNTASHPARTRRRDRNLDSVGGLPCWALEEAAARCCATVHLVAERAQRRSRLLCAL